MADTFPLPASMPLPSDSFWSRLCHTSLSDTLRGKVEGRLDARRVIASFQLGEMLSSVVWDVVQRTRLWRSEKVDVARELASHFREGLDSGRGAEELLADFGAVPLTVKLIRRAKLRSRAWPYHAWQWTWKGAIAVSLVLALIYGLLAWWLHSGKVVIHRNIYAEIESQVQKVPQDDRAWPLYREALSALKPDPDEHGTANFYASAINLTLQSSKEDSQWLAIEEFVSQNQPAITLIRQGAKKKLLGFAANDPENDKWLMAIDERTAYEVNEYVERVREDNRSRYGGYACPTVGIQRLEKLMNVDACVAIQKKDSSRFTEDVEVLVGIGSHQINSQLDITHLLSPEAEGMAAILVRHVLMQQPEMLSRSDLQRLHQLFGRFGWESYRASWSDSAQRRQIAMEDFLQRYFTDDGNGDGHITKEGIAYLDSYGVRNRNTIRGVTWNSPAAVPVRAATFVTRKQVLELSREIEAKSLAMYQLPPWEQAAMEADLIRSFHKAEQSRFQPFHTLLGLPSPKEDIGFRRLLAIPVAVHLGICLELYKRDHGAWPESLEAMVPKYLEEVPLDWMNGKPLGYVMTHDGPQIYSVGANLKDDSGYVEFDQEEGFSYDFPIWPFGRRFR
ncbi:MAG: hypothetical protein U0894_05535 [Pirellulales bacterium]